MALLVGEMYELGEDFVGESESELTVRRGEVVTVQMGEDPGNPGWVYVSGANGAGYVPSSYLLIRGAGAEFEVATETAQTDGVYTNGQGFAPEPFQEVAAPPIPAAITGNPFDAVDSTFGGTSGVPEVSAPGPNWLQRDNDTGEEFFPSISSRRWYYRDLFNDLQGPFNTSEMRHRLDANYVTKTTPILIETGSGATSNFFESKIDELFASELTAFQEPPVVSNAGDELWYFVDGDRYEQGPFSSDQMKVWMEQGYFCSRTSIRRADGREPRKPLFMVFEDPILAFGLSTKQPGQAVVANNRQKSLRHQMSGKDLLKSALEKEPAPTASQQPPKPQPVQTAEVPKATKGKAAMPGEQANKGVVYGGPYPAFAGIPRPEQNASYPNLIYTFLTRPLHPDAGVVRCFIMRHIDSSHINYNKYILYLEETRTPLLAAYRHHHTITNYYDIRLKNTGTLNGRGLTIAHLESSLGGTEFLLHNSVSGHSGKPKDMAFVLYERSRGITTSSSPRKFRAAIPAIKPRSTEYTELPHKGKKKPQIMTSLSALNTNDVIPLLNKPPKWNKRRHAYTLEFKGRAKISSVKYRPLKHTLSPMTLFFRNFQLVDALNDPEHKHVLLSFGKIGSDKFTMDVKHPLSILQAFSVCLSSLHSKKLVE